MKKITSILIFTIITLTACNNPENGANREFYHKYIEAANNRDFAIIESMLNDEVMINGRKCKKEESIAGFKWVINNFPNHRWHIEDLFIDGDRIAVRLRNTGTPKGTSFYGQNPKGASVEFTEFASYKVHDGKFVEMWYLVDAASVIEQLKK